MTDIWSNIPSADQLRSEADVELRLVLPLLQALGYESDEISPKQPVVFHEGRIGRRPEADFVCYWGALRTRDNSLLVIEVKKPDEPLADAKLQGESYAQNLRAPLLLLTNGKFLEIWQMQITLESQCVLNIPITSLVSKRGDIEQLLNKASVREYCQSLSFKKIIEASADFGGYETAELKRMFCDAPTITRTLRRVEVTDQVATLESPCLLSEFSLGAIVTAPSGYGKTTLCRDVFKQAIEGRWKDSLKPISFDVPLPDLEQSGISLVKFMEQRLSAHHPGVTTASFSTMLRDSGVTVFCDSLDQATAKFQKRVVTELTNLLRDFPRVQLFIFSRAALKPNLSLPWLELEPLSDEQIYELEKVILGSGNTQNFSIVSMMSLTLRSLCVNPLLLRLTLEYWKRENDFPRKIEFLFRSWLDSILDTEPNDSVSKVLREQALTLLAEATAAAPISSVDAMTRLSNRNIPITVLNELIQCNAVRMSGAVVELQHDGLSDYLRAKTFAAMNEAKLLQEIETLRIPADSFFPVLLMAQLPSHLLQSALWKHLASGRLKVYLDALRYRFDVSDALRELNSDRLSKDYLNELISGIEVPLMGFFPEIRSSIIGWLTGGADATLAATGRANTSPGVLSYKLHSQESGGQRVTIENPTFPGIIRGVNLDLSRFRLDSARLLGMTILRDTIQESISQLDLKGGPTWAAERLIGRVRYLANSFDNKIKINDSLAKLERVFKPFAKNWVDEGSFFGKERFSVQSLLDDIAMLRKVGITALDPWWSRLGWDENATSNEEEVYRRVLDEEYKRVQQAYAEIVQKSFPSIASEMIYFPILPIRWKLTVQRRERRNGASTIYFHWLPVESWEDAGADVTFTDSQPDPSPEWETIQAALIALGRPHTYIPAYGGWTRHFPYDGTLPNGYFSGTTPVTNQVCSWLQDDIKHLLDRLPSSDGAF